MDKKTVTVTALILIIAVISVVAVSLSTTKNKSELPIDNNTKGTEYNYVEGATITPVSYTHLRAHET